VHSALSGDEALRLLPHKIDELLDDGRLIAAPRSKRKHCCWLHRPFDDAIRNALHVHALERCRHKSDAEARADQTQGRRNAGRQLGRRTEIADARTETAAWHAAMVESYIPVPGGPYKMNVSRDSRSSEIPA